MTYRLRLCATLLALDTCGTALALLAAGWFLGGVDTWEDGRRWLVLLAVLLAPAQALVFTMGGAYRALRSNDLGTWISRAVVGFLSLLGIFAITVFLLKAGDHFSRAAITGWALASLGGIIASRAVAWLMVRARLDRHESGERTLLVGEPAACGTMAGHLIRHPYLGLLPVATLPADPERPRLPDLPRLLDDVGATHVVVCGRLRAQPLVEEVLRATEATAAEVHYVPELGDLPAFCLNMGDLAGRPVFHLATSSLGDTAWLAKWAEDKLLAIVLLVLFAPVLVACAVAVRVSGPGPVLFVQQRHGRGGRVIRVLKFRTMHHPGGALDPPGRPAQRDTAHAPPPPRPAGEYRPDEFVQARHADPRITRVGAFLRRTSLDELPQLWNVLRGDMSLVGPRPHALSHNHQFTDRIESLMRRHYVKPGITGLAQISGARGETRTESDMRRRIELDLAYIRNWSLLLDLQILAKTPFVGFLNRQP